MRYTPLQVSSPSPSLPYHMAGNIGGELNWLMDEKTAKLKSANHKNLKILVSTLK